MSHAFEKTPPSTNRDGNGNGGSRTRRRRSSGGGGDGSDGSGDGGSGDSDAESEATATTVGTLTSVDTVTGKSVRLLIRLDSCKRGSDPVGGGNGIVPTLDPSP